MKTSTKLWIGLGIATGVGLVAWATQDEKTDDAKVALGETEHAVRLAYAVLVDPSPETLGLLEEASAKLEEASAKLEQTEGLTEEQQAAAERLYNDVADAVGALGSAVAGAFGAVGDFF